LRAGHHGDIKHATLYHVRFIDPWCVPVSMTDSASSNPLLLARRYHVTTAKQITEEQKQMLRKVRVYMHTACCVARQILRLDCGKAHVEENENLSFFLSLFLYFFSLFLPLSLSFSLFHSSFFSINFIFPILFISFSSLSLSTISEEKQK
jgi:hypothetical protein